MAYVQDFPHRNSHVNTVTIFIIMELTVMHLTIKSNNNVYYEKNAA